MHSRKIRWSKVYESSEEELLEFFKNRGIHARRISTDEAGETLQQTAKLDATIWCAEGSLAVRIGTASTSLQPGDAMHVPAQTPYDLQAGLTGYVCYVSD